jgi:hypothetical protein
VRFRVEDLEEYLSSHRVAPGGGAISLHHGSAQRAR